MTKLMTSDWDIIAKYPTLNIFRLLDTSDMSNTHKCTLFCRNANYNMLHKTHHTFKSKVPSF